MPLHDEWCECQTCIESFEFYRIFKLNRYSHSGFNLFTCFTCHGHFSSAHELYEHEKAKHARRPSPSSDLAPAAAGDSAGPSASGQIGHRRPEAATRNATARSPAAGEIYECDKCFRVFRKASLLDDHHDVCPRAARSSWAAAGKPVATVQPLQREGATTWVAGETYERSPSAQPWTRRAEEDEDQLGTIHGRTSNDKQRTRCSYCHKVVTCPRNLPLHEATHVTGGKVCWTCKTLFPTLSEFDRHRCVRSSRKYKNPGATDKTPVEGLPASVLPTRPRPKVVHKCCSVKVKDEKPTQAKKKASKSPPKQQKNKSKHKKPFKCLYCDRRFTAERNRKAHQYTHQPYNFVVCNYCDVSFKTHWQLYKHLRLEAHVRKFRAAKRQGLNLFIGNTRTGVKSTALGLQQKDSGASSAQVKSEPLQARPRSVIKAPKPAATCQPPVRSSQPPVKSEPLDVQQPDSKFAGAVVKTEERHDDCHRDPTGKNEQGSSAIKDAETNTQHQSAPATESPSLLGNRMSTFRRGFKCFYCDKVFAAQRNRYLHHYEHKEGKYLECGYCGISFQTHKMLYAHLKKKSHLLKFRAAKKRGLELFIGNSKTGVPSKAGVHGIDDVQEAIKTCESALEDQRVGPQKQVPKQIKTCESALEDQRVGPQKQAPKQIKREDSAEPQAEDSSAAGQTLKPPPSKRTPARRGKLFGVKFYKCSHCSKIFDRRHNLAIHEASHIEGHKGCWGCKQVFTSLKDYEQHTCVTSYRGRHQAALKSARPSSAVTVPAQASATPKLHNTRPRVVARPQQAKESERSRPFPCSHCGRRFHSSSNRNAHEYIHKDTKLFVCEYCETRCQTMKSLYLHMKTTEHVLKFKAGQERGLDLFVGNLKTGRGSKAFH